MMFNGLLMCADSDASDVTKVSVVIKVVPVTVVVCCEYVLCLLVSGLFSVY